MTIKGTKSAQNIITSFAGESQATMRYWIAAKIAKKEGYYQISKIFEETARNEQYHARTVYSFLKDEYKLDGVELNPDYHTFPVVEHDTITNLQGAIDGENEENTEMYPQFAEVAKEEGFDELAAKFLNIAKVEGHHRDRFQKLLDNIKAEKVFTKDEPVKWQCMDCGFIYEGKTAPVKCPVCGAPQSEYQIYAENF
ncbi:MAG: rubrerythrin family protein [Peptoniphilaceae bacterium]|nr:rubrerythrin family protein [Peptoniphilaceae bacterium]MDD7382752.1 rubrerythrin family protein [Peptoniphilaceae bacterium]MDY3737908.1 rubrerythrin family protein [Peptoniphilaceae bacterium]